VPNALKVLTHSVVFMFHTLTEPSELALRTLCESIEKTASFTKLEWPTNSLMSLPDLRPCMRTEQSKDPVNNWLESLENAIDVTPLL
jgi:hypothetical protein